LAAASIARAGRRTPKRVYVYGNLSPAEEGAARIELYKHQSSRRYLNVDAEGNCYVYEGANAARGENPYRKISRREALGNFAVSVGDNRSPVIS
jgi:hypothetical protein